jgi:spore maturation protein CgeB
VKLIYFTHSLLSCWNHGNAHFLRGVLRELTLLGHTVQALEPERPWSLDNLLRDHGDAALNAFRAAYPELRVARYSTVDDVATALDGADAVIVHEWNDPSLVATIGKVRRQGAKFTLLFHDTHHRAVSDPMAVRAFDLDDYDGVLAFGETLAEVYRRWGWGQRAFVWHEAADTHLFRPPDQQLSRKGLVWIGNWGDGERSTELESFLLRPARATGMPLDIHGVRYPDDALRTLAAYGARYRGWLPNAQAPAVFARHLATVHVPRSFYVNLLPGIPTIRVFEALACGIPLVCAPWCDSEDLFHPGDDYLIAPDEAAMTRHLTALRDDPALRAALTTSGLATIRARHSCAHRAAELLGIIGTLRGAPSVSESAA